MDFPKAMDFPKVPANAKAVLRFWRPVFVILVALVSLPLALKGGVDSNGTDLTKVKEAL
jgi:hypothetical protein